MIQELKWIWQHPPAAGRGLNRVYHTRLGHQVGYQKGTPIFDLDWDICVILDACRFDFYQSIMSEEELSGELEKRLSPAASTPEWLDVELSQYTYPDTVYVTGNPQYYNHRDDVWPTFHEAIEVWREGWNEATQTVHPSTMVDALSSAAEEYSNKRLLAHFVQPHVPFIGEIGREKFPINTSDSATNEWNAARNFWPSIRRGERDHSRSDLQQAYRENIELTIDTVLPALKRIEGKTIITSDHGQLLGERISPIPIREYGHPAGLYVPELVETPLHTLPYEQRREIIEGSLESAGDKDADDAVEKRLNALGYR